MLCAHRGTTIVDEKTVFGLTVPDGTPSWKPVPHAEVLTCLRQEIQSRNLQFRNPQNPFELSLSSDGMKMFGVAELTGMIADDEYSLCIGFRNSNDKSLALHLVSGPRVFVCDNLAISGDHHVYRKHTSGIVPSQAITEALNDALASVDVLTRRMDLLKDTEVSLDHAAGVFLTLASTTSALLVYQLTSCWENYQALWNANPRNPEELQGLLRENAELPAVLHTRTMWGVVQMVAGTWKKRNPVGIPDYSRDLMNVLFPR